MSIVLFKSKGWHNLKSSTKTSKPSLESFEELLTPISGVQQGHNGGDGILYGLATVQIRLGIVIAVEDILNDVHISDVVDEGVNDSRTSNTGVESVRVDSTRQGRQTTGVRSSESDPFLPGWEAKLFFNIF